MKREGEAMYERAQEGLHDTPYSKLQEDNDESHWAPSNRRRRRAKLRLLVLATAALLVVGVLVGALVTIFGVRSEQQGSPSADDIQLDLSKLATSGPALIVESRKTGQLNATAGANGVLPLQGRPRQPDSPVRREGESANFPQVAAEVRTSGRQPELPFRKTARSKPKVMVLDQFPLEHADFKQRSNLVGRVRKKSAALPPVAVGNTHENEVEESVKPAGQKDVDKWRKGSISAGYEEEAVETKK